MNTAAERLAQSLAGRYRVERELGAGGMAMVYLAHDLRHDRKVALKVLRPELAAVIGAERFLHEIKTTANLQHPHILALFDSGQVDGTDGRVLAFSEITQSGGIWISRREVDGSWGAPVQRLGSGILATWSPDGKQLLYNDGLRGGGLWVVPVDSGSPRELFDSSKPGQPFAELSRWSPDGATAYFKSHDATGNASLWSVPVRGGAPRMLFPLGDPSRPSYRAVWDYGGGRAYFTIEDRQSDIFVLEVNRR